MKDPLFAPIHIGPVQVKNRIFMPAMHMNMCSNHIITEPLIEFYRARAKGGAGLISVGYATVDEYSGTPTNIGAHSDDHLPGLTALAEAIHEGGALATVQLNHAGRYNSSFFLGGNKPVAPSAVPCRLTRETPREMDLEEIGATIRRFGDAAVRVREAGYDMVEILAGTGYLISEFLSPLTNRRKDQYGITLENRMRFGLEVIAAVRRRVGPDFPILVRINGNDFMAGGIGAQDLRTFAAVLVEAGVDALCVNVGWHEAEVPQIVTKVPRGVYGFLARDIKQLVDVPVIASHRINDPETARYLITNDFCDMVAIGRGLIADPEFPRKAEAGREKDIVHCVACGQGCFDHIFKMKPVECLCNPRAGHEHEPVPPKSASPRKVLVVGGGVAGMSVAMAAAERGHAVTLVEKSMRLGGQLHLAGAPPGRSEFLVLAEDLGRKLAGYPVKVVLNRAVDATFLKQEQPDVVILASGGKPIIPKIDGADLPHVVQAWDVLSRKVSTGKKVVLIGGGAVGVETALMLREEGTISGEELKFLLVHSAVSQDKLLDLATKGVKEVSLIEMTDKVGANFGKSTRWGMLQDIVKTGIHTLESATVVRITDSSVVYEKGGERGEIEADTVVLAVGTVPEHSLADDIRALGLKFMTGGDASDPATVFEANHQGWRAGLSIE